MKMLTKEIERKLEKAPLHSAQGPIAEAQIVVKFFNPTGRSNWFVVEGERQEDGDWLFFGFVQGELDETCDEFGYFRLSELEAVTVRFGLKLERDRYFSGTIGEVQSKPALFVA